jgi:xanthine dehydrogenase accessory factor
VRWQVEVLVDAVAAGGVDDALRGALIAARQAKRAVVLATWLDGARHDLVAPGAEPAELAAAVGEAIAGDRAVVSESGVFVEPHLPPLRLIVVGAVHVAQPLAEWRRSLGSR